ncbi:Vacuolar protein sorting-associated protein 13A, partial [Atta colombica]
TCLTLFLIKLRTGVSYSILSILFGIQRRTNDKITTMLIADRPYMYIEKSNYSFQSVLFLYKDRSLIKSMVVNTNSRIRKCLIKTWKMLTNIFSNTTQISYIGDYNDFRKILEYERKDGFDPVKDCYCQYKTGAQTVGCCMYIASVLWYLEYYRYMENTSNFQFMNFLNNFQMAQKAIKDASAAAAEAVKTNIKDVQQNASRLLLFRTFDMFGRLNKINLLLGTFEDSKPVQAVPSAMKSEYSGDFEVQLIYKYDASREIGLARFSLTHFALKGTNSVPLSRPRENLEEHAKYNARSMPNDTFADVPVFSFSIIVFLDYLMKIKDFFDVDELNKTAVASSSKNEVLRPCSISVAGSTPEGKGLHLEVRCTDIHMSVSPSVIEILNKVIHTVTKKEEEDKEVVKPEPNYEGLWIVTPFEENNYWFLKTALEEFTYPDDEVAAPYKPELAIVSPTILFTLTKSVSCLSCKTFLYSKRIIFKKFHTLQLKTYKNHYSNIEKSCSLIIYLVFFHYCYYYYYSPLISIMVYMTCARRGNFGQYRWTVYMTSVEPFVWKDLQKKTTSMTKLLKCESRSKQEPPFFYRTILYAEYSFMLWERSSRYFENTTRHTMANTVNNTSIPVSMYLKNFLLIDIIIGIHNQLVLPSECAALLPRTEHDNKILQAKVASQLEQTWHLYRQSHNSAELDNKHEGINVDIQINEGGVYISMSVPRNAPAMIINNTPHTINLWEKGSLNVRSIQSYNRMFYTWENPAESRKLMWEDNIDKEIENNLRKDNLGTFQLSEMDEKLFYVFFLDGTQRVLLFTTNLKIAEDYQLAGDLEIIDQEITLNIHGIGFSLVNNTKSELLYMCIDRYTSGFSITGSGGGPSALSQVLNVLLQGIGVTLTDINDFMFKLAYFERNYVFMTHKQLVEASHYAGQTIKQVYILVLGLDDPYGLVVETIKDIEDLFYEPFQGAIQGPGEFTEDPLLRGKGIAALIFDKDYQRKRQEQLNKQLANLQEGLARSGKGLVMGVVDGKEEGVKRFCKGFGKDVVGLVTTLTAGKRVRSPRFLQPDSLVRPYIKDEAEGNKILIELEKGKYAYTAVYVDWSHTWNEFSESAKVVEKGVQIFIKDTSKKKKLGLFSSTSQSKILLISDFNIKQLLCSKIQEQINQSGA